MWRMLKAFHSMPPFGPDWFGVFKEKHHPLVMMRMEWIFLNIKEDERVAFENRKEEIEYGGYFSGPEVYAHLKGITPENSADQGGGVQGNFKIEYDTSAFTERLDKAFAGEVITNPDRNDIAQRVREKRREMAEKEQVADPRISRYPTESDYGDGLVIERKRKKDV